MSKFSVVLEVSEPQLSVIKHEIEGCDCRFLQMFCNGDDDQLLLHFKNLLDLEAFYGLLGIALGKTP